MLLVNLIANKDQWGTFFNMYPLSNFDSTVKFVRNSDLPASMEYDLMDWSFIESVSVIHAEIQLESRKYPSDNVEMNRLGRSRFLDWRTSGYPNADKGIPEFFSELTLFDLLQPMWCCVGHITEEDPEGEAAGYICFTGLQSDLLAIGKAFREAATTGISVELESLQYQDHHEFDIRVVYPVLALRWWAVSELEQRELLTQIANFINMGVTKVHLNKMHR